MGDATVMLAAVEAGDSKAAERLLVLVYDELRRLGASKMAARVAGSYVSSEENNTIFGRPQSFVTGPPTNGVQFMVKDSKTYAATAGWGFAHFNDGKPAEEAVLQSCFPCHQDINSPGFIFTLDPPYDLEPRA